MSGLLDACGMIVSIVGVLLAVPSVEADEDCDNEGEEPADDVRNDLSAGEWPVAAADGANDEVDRDVNGVYCKQQAYPDEPFVTSKTTG